MKFRLSIFFIRKERLIFFLVLLLLALSLCACGKRGVPLPPSLVVPEKINDLRLQVLPGERYLVWSMPRTNADDTKPVDLVSFKVRLKKVAKNLDSCRYCDEGFFDYLTINVVKPDIGQQRGSSFYLPLPGIEENYIYVFSIISLNSRGWSSEDSNKLAVVGLPHIVAPLAVRLTPSASIVELSWDVPALPSNFTGLLRYRVYRRSSGMQGEQWRLITPEAIADNKFIDVGLNDWHSYVYAVTSVVMIEETSCESDYSVSPQIVPGDYIAPDKLENFSAFYYEAGVQLIWDPSSAADLSGYNVYRRDDVTGLERKIAVMPSTHPEYFDLDVISGRTYFYRVTAFDLSDRKNESGFTDEIAVKVR